MKKIIFFMTALVAVFIISGIIQAAEKTAAPKTIAGVWSVIETEGVNKGKEKAQIEISDKGGVYEGKYVKLPFRAPGELCKVCTDERKDKPYMGMVIIYNMKNDDNEYVGKIYSTEKGKEYKCKMSLENPDKLKMKACLGFICPSTQIWDRIK